MVKRLAVGALAMVGLFAWCSSAVEAGGAAGAATLDTFFECAPINGGNLNQVVSTEDFGGTTVTPNIRLGNAVLVCRQVNVKSQGNVVNPPEGQTDLKCYSVTTPGPQDKAVNETLADAFTTEQVTVSQAPRLLCGPVLTTIP